MHALHITMEQYAGGTFKLEVNNLKREDSQKSEEKLIKVFELLIEGYLKSDEFKKYFLTSGMEIIR